MHGLRQKSGHTGISGEFSGRIFLMKKSMAVILTLAALFMLTALCASGEETVLECKTVSCKLTDSILVLEVDGVNLSSGELTYKITDKQSKEVSEGKATYTVDGNQLTVSFGDVFRRFGKYAVECSLTSGGKDYSFSINEVFVGTEAIGFDSEFFKDRIAEGATLSNLKQSFSLTQTIGGREYTLKIGLALWEGYTTKDQIKIITDLFFANYPVLYERFGQFSNAPLGVEIAIENSGYEIASASAHLYTYMICGFIIHDKDYDCLTHELLARYSRRLGRQLSAVIY